MSVGQRMARSNCLVEDFVEPSRLLVKDIVVHSDCTFDDLGDALSALKRFARVNNYQAKILPKGTQQARQSLVRHNNFAPTVRRQQHVASVLIAGYVNDVRPEVVELLEQIGICHIERSLYQNLLRESRIFQCQFDLLVLSFQVQAAPNVTSEEQNSQRVFLIDLSMGRRGFARQFNMPGPWRPLSNLSAERIYSNQCRAKPGRQPAPLFLLRLPNKIYVYEVLEQRRD